MKNFCYITILVLLLLNVAIPELYSQKGFGNENYIAPVLYTNPIDKNQIRIGRIEFEGNEFFNDFQLSSIIVSKVSSESLPHEVMAYYYDNVKKIDVTPEYLKKTLLLNLQEYNNELFFFIESKAKNDIETLEEFYNTNGFHDATAKFAFYPDTNEYQNVLKFYINEHERYKIADINYSGLDSLPDDLQEKITKIRKIEVGEYFEENKVINEVNLIYNFLQNNGYFFSEYYFEPVTIDSDSLTDSINVNFLPGRRYRIENVWYTDSTYGNKAVASSMKDKNLTFKEGDWYSREKIQQSERNLNSLGVFQSVTIDTTGFSEGDTSLNFTVFMRYKDPRSWNAGFFINQTTETNNYFNFGLEGDFSYKNIFGAAENFSLYGNTTIKNYTGKLFPSFREFELQGRIGFLFQQPLVLIVDNTRFGLETRFEYELSRYRDMLLRKISFPRARFPFKLPTVTYLNRGYLEFILEEERPMDSIQTTQTELNQDILQYSILQRYFDDAPVFKPTALIFGAALIGDSKNHPFTPNHGNYSFISADFGLLDISQYARFIFQRNDYFSSRFQRHVVHATKFRLGNIFLFNPDGYVPFDRQFYAGGANSVRGWQARTLHAYDEDAWENPDNFEEGEDPKQEFEDFSNLIGNGGLLEISYEFRYQFTQSQDMTPAIAEQLANLGFALFFDAGNAFNWYASEGNELPFLEYFDPSNWGYSAGVGIRYKTPIGPVRLDIALPLYGPVYRKKDWIVDRQNVLGDLQFHISIGNPF